MWRNIEQPNKTLPHGRRYVKQAHFSRSGRLLNCRFLPINHCILSHSLHLISLSAFTAAHCVCYWLKVLIQLHIFLRNLHTFKHVHIFLKVIVSQSKSTFGILFKIILSDSAPPILSLAFLPGKTVNY